MKSPDGHSLKWTLYKTDSKSGTFSSQILINLRPQSGYLYRKIIGPENVRFGKFHCFGISLDNGVAGWLGDWLGIGHQKSNFSLTSKAKSKFLIDMNYLDRFQHRCIDAIATLSALFWPALI